MSVLENLPAELAGRDTAHAVRLVQSYFDPSPLMPHHFSGAYFERLDGGGDRAGVRNRITGADIVAVSMLSVTIPSDSVKKLDELSDTISDHLEHIPWDLNLVDAGADQIGESSPAWKLWDALTKIDHIGWVTANKLLARKRPLLLPVYDNVVRDLFDAPTSLWASLQATLASDDRALFNRLLAIREAAGVGDDISPLRVFDVVCWRLGMGYTCPE